MDQPPSRMPSLCLPGIEQYAEEHTSPEPDRLLHLAAETREASRAAQMMVGQLEGRFLKMLVHMTRARRVLEIGTFTGYSALSMAEALPADGQIVTLEINSKHEAIARRHIDMSPYARQIDVRMGPALDSLRELEGPFDLVFIDADKGNYLNYLEAVLPMLSPHGVIAADNVLWSGKVLDPADQEEDTKAIRAFNDAVRSDPRLECVMLTVRDGVTLIRRAG
jgi:caffeoyl-CoA O-methyltransferase